MRNVVEDNAATESAPLKFVPPSRVNVMSFVSNEDALIGCEKTTSSVETGALRGLGETVSSETMTGATAPFAQLCKTELLTALPPKSRMPPASTLIRSEER